MPGSRIGVELGGHDSGLHRPLREMAGVDRSEIDRETRREHREQIHQQIAEILTPEQLEKFENLAKDRGQGQRQFRGRGGRWSN